jgi:hypothetical protein
MILENNILKQFKLANFEVFYHLYKSYSYNYIIHNIFLLIELFQVFAIILSNIVRIKI